MGSYEIQLEFENTYVFGRDERNQDTCPGRVVGIGWPQVRRLSLPRWKALEGWISFLLPPSIF